MGPSSRPEHTRFGRDNGANLLWLWLSRVRKTHGIDRMEYEVFVPTPESIIEAKLDFAEVQPGDTVFDLGCGDARVLIAAAQKYRVRAVGVEIRSELVATARETIRTQQLENLIELREEDYLVADISEADVLIIYLTRGSLGPLSIRLETDLRPGARIVTHQFDLPGWTPECELKLKMPDGTEETLYRYRRQAA